MNVRQVVGHRDIADLATVSETQTLADAARILSERRIGAVVVTHPDGSLAGILSERDIVRRVAAEGAGALDHPISGVMTSEVVSCAPTDQARSLLQIMTDGRFRHMPVVEDGKLAGIITIGDVVKAHISEIEMEKQAMEDMIRGA